MSVSEQLLKTENTTIVLVNAGPQDAVLRFSGEIVDSNPGEYLDQLFDRVDTIALERALTSISVDLMALEFMNSSGIKAFVKWVMKLAANATDGAYVVRFQYSPDVTWQRSSLIALAKLGKGRVSVEAV